MEYKRIKIWVLKMWVRGEGGGKNLASGWYTPLYENGIKKTQNKSMETTKTMYFWIVSHAISL